MRDLAATSAGGLVAWVQGSVALRHARRSRQVDHLASDCTCPYGGTCKHAVAVALAYVNRPEPGVTLAGGRAERPPAGAA